MGVTVLPRRSSVWASLVGSPSQVILSRRVAPHQDQNGLLTE